MASAKEKQFARLMAELVRPETRDELDELLLSPPPPPDFLDRNFPEQCAFIEDPARLKVSLCTRRAGKSFADGIYLFKEAFDNPGCSVVYFGLTRQSAKNVMWKDVLTVINDKHKIGAKPNLSELSWTLPNGSVIYLFGVDSNESEMRKVFGQKFKLAVIDEAALYTIDLRNLVYSVLQPAMIDGDGTICLTGMPSNLRRGLFFQLTQDTVRDYSEDDEDADGFTDDDDDETEELAFDFSWSEDKRRWQVADRAEGDVWSGHFWTANENPHTRERWAAKIEKKKSNNPRIEETPIFKQEYLGQWVVDGNKFVYKYDPKRNSFTYLPEHTGAWSYVLGVDLGHEDDSAFVVLAYHPHDQTAYILESWSRKKMDITDVAERIKFLSMRYDFETIVVDGSNKMAVEEMKKRHDLWGIQAVQKKYKVGDSRRAKANVIEVMNGDFVMGRIKVHPVACASLTREYENLIWDDTGKAGALGPRQEHPRCANHNCFVAGTLVQTEHGARPIETLEPGDLVWTREGLRPVVVRWQSGIQPIWTLETDAGTLRGTHDHPVWTQDGWKPLSELTARDDLVAWQRESAPCRVLSVVHPTDGDRPEPVFALSVDGVHEFFANDVLVSNCDAAFYAWLSVHSYLSAAVELPPQPGTEAFYDAEARRLEQRDSEDMERSFRKAQQDAFDDFENGYGTVIDVTRYI